MLYLHCGLLMQEDPEQLNNLLDKPESYLRTIGKHFRKYGNPLKRNRK